MSKQGKLDRIFRIKHGIRNNTVGIQFESRKDYVWISKYDWLDLSAAIMEEMRTHPGEPTLQDKITTAMEKGDFKSGRLFAKKLGISHQAVNEAVRKLRKRGVLN